jgi:hypothetical protein
LQNKNVPVVSRKNYEEWHLETFQRLKKIDMHLYGAGVVSL